MSAPAVKIVNPDWPHEYLVINAVDFDASRDQLWPDGKVAWEKGRPQPEGYQVDAPPEPVAVPEPVPPARFRATELASTRILDLGPEIAKCLDLGLLRELDAIEVRTTVRRMIAVRLKELGG